MYLKNVDRFFPPFFGGFGLVNRDTSVKKVFFLASILKEEFFLRNKKIKVQ